jgi:hypothetical protein
LSPRVTVPKCPVTTLAPLVTYTRAEILYALHVAEHVGPLYLAPPSREP